MEKEENVFNPETVLSEEDGYMDMILYSIFHENDNEGLKNIAKTYWKHFEKQRGPLPHDGFRIIAFSKEPIKAIRKVQDLIMNRIVAKDKAMKKGDNAIKQFVRDDTRMRRRR